MQYAAAAFFVNLFCFVFVQGTYLNRYLILAVIFFGAGAGRGAAQGLEKGRLRSLLLLAVCAQLALSSGMMLRDAKSAEPHAQERGADMMEAATI